MAAASAINRTVAHPPHQARGASVHASGYRSNVFMTGFIAGNHHRNPLPESV
ncbi:hypothetical protein B0G83_104284 [Paraburkholderia sp. BL21I4N1]|nr:hypothetical protein B0G83_104284 [Paraburkholderia sp. BL21I4N1]